MLYWPLLFSLESCKIMICSEEKNKCKHFEIDSHQNRPIEILSFGFSFGFKIQGKSLLTELAPTEKKKR